jgi:Zn-dependent oligopeptidase
MQTILSTARSALGRRAAVHRAWGTSLPSLRLGQCDRQFATETADLQLLPASGLPPYAQVTPSFLKSTILQRLEEVDAKVDVFMRRHTAAIATGADLHVPAILAEYDSLTRELGHAWGMINHLLSVKNTDKLRDVISELQPKVVQKMAEVGQTQEIYAIWEKLVDGNASDNVHGVGDVERRLINKHLFDARMVGAGLPSGDREKFTELLQEKSRLSTEFQNNVIDATKLFLMTITDPKEVKGMPTSLLERAAENARMLAANAPYEPEKQTVADNFGDDDGGNFGEPVSREKKKEMPAYTAAEGPWTFTLDGATVIPFMKTCPSTERREEMQLAQFSRAGNLQVMMPLIVVRTI